jgi:hypothetical protein
MGNTSREHLNPGSPNHSAEALPGAGILGKTVQIGSAFFLIIMAHYCFKAITGGLIVSRLTAFGLPKVDLMDVLITLAACSLLYSAPKLTIAHSGSRAGEHRLLPGKRVGFERCPH